MTRPYVFLDQLGRGDLGLCLIVEHPTGVEYGRQCGGYLCEEKVMEGYLIPLGQREIETRIFEFFDQEFAGHCYPPRNDWTPERITRLNALLSEISCIAWAKDSRNDREGPLELDRARIGECIEAWIPVQTPCGRGVLTLVNTD